MVCWTGVFLIIAAGFISLTAGHGFPGGSRPLNPEAFGASSSSDERQTQSSQTSAASPVREGSWEFADGEWKWNPYVDYANAPIGEGALYPVPEEEDSHEGGEDANNSTTLPPPPGMFAPGPRVPTPPLALRVPNWRTWSPSASNPWVPSPPVPKTFLATKQQSKLSSRPAKSFSPKVIAAPFDYNAYTNFVRTILEVAGMEDDDEDITEDECGPIVPENPIPLEAQQGSLPPGQTPAFWHHSQELPSEPWSPRRELQEQSSEQPAWNSPGPNYEQTDPRSSTWETWGHGVYEQQVDWNDAGTQMPQAQSGSGMGTIPSHENRPHPEPDWEGARVASPEHSESWNEGTDSGIGDEERTDTREGPPPEEFHPPEEP